MRVRVYYEDTDMAGVVYYANYLRFLERARTDFLEKRGLDLKSLAAAGIQITIKDICLDYKAPAVYGDILDIDTRLSRLQAARFRLAHTISRDNGRTLIAKAELTCVCVDRNFKPLRIPAEVESALTQ